MEISIHALREEGDSTVSTANTPQSNFYPRPPRGGRPKSYERVKKSQEISIHALREEGDSAATATKPATVYFYPRPPRGGRHTIIRHLSPEFKISIHALREEGDRRPRIDLDRGNLFLSTPSARRATLFR